MSYLRATREAPLSVKLTSWSQVQRVDHLPRFGPIRFTAQHSARFDCLGLRGQQRGRQKMRRWKHIQALWKKRGELAPLGLANSIRLRAHLSGLACLRVALLKPRRTGCFSGQSCKPMAASRLRHHQKSEEPLLRAWPEGRAHQAQKEKG